MSSYKIIFFVSFLSFVFGCTSPSEYDPEEYSKFDYESEIAPLLNDINNNGDTSSYKKLWGYYLDDSRPDEILFYSMYMANKYNFRPAYFHVYFILAHPPSGDDFENFDPKSKKISLYYLLKSYELGFESARFVVEELFKNKEIPKASSMLLRLSEIESN